MANDTNELHPAPHDRGALDSAERRDPPQRLGPYELQRRIGSGGMGDVYLGYDRTLDRCVAIKVLPDELARHSDFVRRFHSEASAAAQLTHPNVIAIHFIGEDSGRHYFVMPFVEGESLAERLSRQGRLSADEALPIVDDVLAGLAAAHAQGLIHRDIKPGNILIEQSSGRAVVADFGLVKSLKADATARTATGVVLGTADYLAPEQTRARCVDHRCDLYAVGVLLYQMLAGRLPFSADSPTGMIFQHAYERPTDLRELVPELPPHLWNVVARLMAKSPDARFPSAQLVRDDLQAIRDHKPLPSASDRLDLESFWKPMSRRPDDRPLTQIVEAPTFEVEPAEPELVTGGRWWSRVRNRWADWWSARRPEWIAALETTQQQEDGAIAEYQRRQAQLKLLVREAESVLADLKAQRGRAPDEANLSSPIHDQAEELDSMRLKLAHIDATLGRLRAQRDLLNARLKAGRARRQLEAGVGVGRRRGLARTAAQLTLLLVLLSVLAVIVRTQWLYLVAFFTVDPLKQSVVNKALIVVPSGAANAGEPLFAADVVNEPAVRARLLSNDARLTGYSADGGFVGIVSQSGLVEFRGATDGQFLASLELPKENTQTIVLDSGGRYFACATSSTTGAHRSVEVRDLHRTGQVHSTVSIEAGAEALAIGGDPPVVWTFTDAAEGATLKAWTSAGVEAAAVALNMERPKVWATDTVGRRLAIGSVRHEVQVFNSAESSAVTATVLPTPARRLGFHPREPWLAVVPSADDRIVLWNLDTQQPFAELFHAGEPVLDLAFDRSGRRLAVASDKRIRVWDVELHCVRLVVPASETRAMTFSPDGAQLAAVDDEGNLTLWATALPVVQSDLTAWLKAQDETRAAAIEPYRPLRSVGSPHQATTVDGRLTVVAPVREAPYLEETATHEKFFDFATKPVLSVAVSPNGKWAVTGGFEREQGTGDIRLWELRSGREIGMFPGHVHYANSLAFSPDSRFLLSGGRSTMYLWDVGSRTQVRRFSVAFTTVNRVAFSPDGRHALARTITGGRQNNRSVFFCAATGEALWDFYAEVPEWAFAPREIFADSQFGQWRTMIPETETKQ